MTDRTRANAKDGGAEIVSCACGLTFTKLGFLELDEAGALKNDGELMELRRCVCSRVLAVSRSPDSVRGR